MAAVTFDDVSKMRALLKRLSKTEGAESAIKILEDGIEKHKLSKELLYDQIKSEYLNGLSVRSISRKFNVPPSLISSLVREEGLENAEAVQSNPRIQINVRLSEDDSKRLNKLYNYWGKVGKVNFLDSAGTGELVFGSPTSFARFILEAGVSSLYADYLNEQSIDELANFVRHLRLDDFGAKTFLDDHMPDYEDHLRRFSPEMEKYMELIDSKCKVIALEWAKSSWGEEETSFLFEAMWPKALRRSLNQPVQTKISRDLALRARRLKG